MVTVQWMRCGSGWGLPFLDGEPRAGSARARAQVRGGRPGRGLARISSPAAWIAGVPWPRVRRAAGRAGGEEGGPGAGPGAGAGEDLVPGGLDRGGSVAEGPAGGVQGGGEGETAGVGAGAGGGVADEGADGLVGDEEGPDFLAGEAGGAGAEDAAAGEVGLGLAVGSLDSPAAGVGRGEVGCGIAAPVQEGGDGAVPLGAGGAVLAGHGDEELDDADGDVTGERAFLLGEAGAAAAAVGVAHGPQVRLAGAVDH